MMTNREAAIAFLRLPFTQREVIMLRLGVGWTHNPRTDVMSLEMLTNVRKAGMVQQLKEALNA